jgi:RNA-directed DNA polymerase
MSPVRPEPREGGDTRRWQPSDRPVLKRPTRRSRAQPRGEAKTVRPRHTRWMTAWAATRRAGRRVTPAKRGTNTAGGDGMPARPPPQRRPLAVTRRLSPQAAPGRRGQMPQPGREETRPGGMPPRGARAGQRLGTMARAPPWAAPGEPHSAGFRPGRSAGDASGAIAVQRNPTPTWVLAADLAPGVERLTHHAWLTKVGATPPVTRPLRAWLNAGGIDTGNLCPPDAGTPPGGTASPLLAPLA